MKRFRSLRLLPKTPSTEVVWRTYGGALLSECGVDVVQHTHQCTFATKSFVAYKYLPLRTAITTLVRDSTVLSTAMRDLWRLRLVVRWFWSDSCSNNVTRAGVKCIHTCIAFRSRVSNVTCGLTHTCTLNGETPWGRDLH